MKRRRAGGARAAGVTVGAVAVALCACVGHGTGSSATTGYITIPPASSTVPGTPAQAAAHGTTPAAHGTSGGAPHGGGSSPPGGAGGSSAGTGGSSPAYLTQLLQEADAAAGNNYKATYKAVGSSATITFAQLGARMSFSGGGTAYYSNGTNNTVCDSTNSPTSCYTGAKPLTGVLALISPKAVANAVLQAQSAQASSVRHDDEHHDGLASTCLAYTLQLQRIKYCLDDQGVVTYIKIPRAAFVLTDYTTSVSAADVTTPPGAITRPTPS